jgi:hypothetical protein
MSFPPGTEMFQFPGFASHAYGFSVRSPIAGRGCPIRRSSDQSLLAAPQGFSQRATSFIASWRQGIHQMPLLSSAPTSDNRTVTPRDLRSRGDPDPHGHGPCEEKTDAAAAAGNDSSVNCKLQVLAVLRLSAGRQAYPCQTRVLPQTERRKQDRATCRRPPYQAHDGIASTMPPTTGTSSPPHDVQGTRPPPPGPDGPAMGADGVRLPRAAGQRPGPRRPRRPEGQHGPGGPGPT